MSSVGVSQPNSTFVHPERTDRQIQEGTDRLFSLPTVLDEEQRGGDRQESTGGRRMGHWASEEDRLSLVHDDFEFLPSRVSETPAPFFIFILGCLWAEFYFDMFFGDPSCFGVSEKFSEELGVNS